VTAVRPPASSHHIDLGAGVGEVHYLDFGGPAAGSDSGPPPRPGRPPIVAVHGLGGSALNWLRVGPALADRTRVVALDLRGFGLSFPRGRSGSVDSNTDVLDRFIRTVTGGRAVLVANSMGCLISMRQASRHPETVAGLALLDPVLPRPRGGRLDRQVAAVFLLYLTPWVGSRFLASRRAQMSPRQLVLDTLTLCCVDPAAVPAEFIDAAVAQAERRHVAGDGFTPAQLDVAFLQAARSLMRAGARRNAYAEMMRRITAPVVLLHGEKDRLVPVAAARAAARVLPAWAYHEYADVGHVPMIEIPDEVVARVDDLLAQVDATG
jgi:pimeloyl-ACP methyl ester carboxylesterase